MTEILKQMSALMVCYLLVLFALFEPAAAQPAAQMYAVERFEFSGLNRADEPLVRLSLQPLPAQLSADAVSESIRSLLQLGFFRTVEAEYLADRATLKFHVTERPLVGRILIRGNDSVSQEDLSEVLRFRTNRFFDESAVRAVINDALKLYRQRGFFRADISYSATIEDDNVISLNFEVDE